MGILESINLEVIDLGESPIRLGGMKVGGCPCSLGRSDWAACVSVTHMPSIQSRPGCSTQSLHVYAFVQVYDTREDNLIMEAPVIFGSGLRVRVSAKLRVPGTGYAVYLPVEVSNIQVGHCSLQSCIATPVAVALQKIPTDNAVEQVRWQLCWPSLCMSRDLQLRAVARITMSPIVETLPCVGGVTISLLKVCSRNLPLARQPPENTAHRHAALLTCLPCIMESNALQQSA